MQTKILTELFFYFNCVVSTLEGVSFPLIIVAELNAMAFIMAAIFLISNVPISSDAL